MDRAGLLWIADACNHRIQVFDLSAKEPELVRIWGSPGLEPGCLQTPYGIEFDTDGTLLVRKYGNHGSAIYTLAVLGGLGWVRTRARTVAAPVGAGFGRQTATARAGYRKLPGPAVPPLE